MEAKPVIMETNTKGKNMAEQKNKTVFEQLWLSYYNDTLFAKGVISEDQYNKIRLLIQNRTNKK